MWVLFDALLSVGVFIERALRLTRLLDTGVGGLENSGEPVVSAVVCWLWLGWVVGWSVVFVSLTDV